MQKLDLSLDIPGAPFVRYAAAEPDPDTAEAYAVDAAWPMPGPLEAHPARSVWVDKSASTESGELAAEDVEVRQKVMDALRQFGHAEMSVVPSDATVQGDLVCKSIRIQGELSGSVSASGLVWVEEGAVLNGRVLEAEMVVLFGTVATAVNQAAIRCSGLVVLAESARVIGHVQCGAVAIYQGARLVGTVQTCSE